jgi:hypothetical protein
MPPSIHASAHIHLSHYILSAIDQFNLVCICIPLNFAAFYLRFRLLKLMMFHYTHVTTRLVTGGHQLSHMAKVKKSIAKHFSCACEHWTVKTEKRSKWCSKDYIIQYFQSLNFTKSFSVVASELVVLGCNLKLDFSFQTTTQRN